MIGQGLIILMKKVCYLPEARSSLQAGLLKLVIGYIKWFENWKLKLKIKEIKLTNLQG